MNIELVDIHNFVSILLIYMNFKVLMKIGVNLMFFTFRSQTTRLQNYFKRVNEEQSSNQESNFY